MGSRIFLFDNFLYFVCVLRLLSLLVFFIWAGEINFSYAQILHPRIMSFKIKGSEQNIPVSSVINLPDRKNSFSLEYGVADNIDASQIKYKYKLEGFDGDWTDAGNRQYINYTNLPGGTYRFMLQASADGIHWFEMGNPVTVHISVPFYNTVWFLILITLTIIIASGLIIYFAYSTQLQRILMAQKIRNNIASDLHDDIGSTLSGIMLMSELAKKQPGEAGNYFDQIKENSRTIIENMNDIVWAVNPKNDSMSEILSRMQSFASGLLEKKNITLEFVPDPGIESVRLGMEERKNFYLIFKETIHNAFKYAQCTKVRVQLYHDDKAITMKIEDDGKGFDTAKKYMGNGLHNLQKRADEMQGKLQINSIQGKGTIILLCFKTTQTGS